MKHYMELDPRAVRGLVFDIDDTVTKGGVLEADAFAAMHMMRDAGFELVAVTGRPLGWTDVVGRMWPITAAVGENGAGWTWVEDGRARQGYFDDVATRESHRRQLDAIEAEVAARFPSIHLANDRGARRCDLAFDIGEEASLTETEIADLVAVIEAHGASSSVSTVHAHATPGSWDKASGVERAVQEVLGVELGQELDRWVFIGDSGNDAAAFSHFPLSVGVANVREHLHRLPTPPRYVTDSHRGRGFAELADHLRRGRG